MVFQIGIGIAIAISISDEDRDWDRDLDFGDRGHALDLRSCIEMYAQISYAIFFEDVSPHSFFAFFKLLAIPCTRDKTALFNRPTARKIN